jgi:catechol 2,3-dioxygenase-like lactoylglutathione lyase family enzyme
MPPTFSHLRLCVTDFASTVRFYHELLGFPMNMPYTDDVYTEINTGAVTLALFNKAMMADVVGAGVLPAKSTAQDNAVIVLMVPNVDQAVAALAEKGLSPIVPPTDRPAWGLRTVHYRDPEGNLVELATDLSTTMA